MKMMVVVDSDSGSRNWGMQCSSGDFLLGLG